MIFYFDIFQLAFVFLHMFAFDYDCVVCLDNFVFRKLEPPDLLQSCPSCGAGYAFGEMGKSLFLSIQKKTSLMFDRPIKWSAIRNKRHVRTRV